MTNLDKHLNISLEAYYHGFLCAKNMQQAHAGYYTNEQIKSDRPHRNKRSLLSISRTVYYTASLYNKQNFPKT
ncbi:hypothetical protein [Nostoc sp. MS1]|uniref:hypothetical protein n=1 Tax=Nostoc sp. MS1 TaxID=2764711 RepID=UPI001CC679F7|nr:hypothetical protein [Nostoc sp. MS1]